MALLELFYMQVPEQPWRT